MALAALLAKHGFEQDLWGGLRCSLLYSYLKFPPFGTPPNFNIAKDFDPLAALDPSSTRTPPPRQVP